MKQHFFTTLTLSLLAIACHSNTSNESKNILSELSFDSVEGRVGDALSAIPNDKMLGSIIQSCTISPALPQGLWINKTTCAVSGTPTTGISETDFTVTATNLEGSVSSQLKLRVLQYRGEPVANFGNSDGSVLFDIRSDTSVSGTWYKDQVRKSSIQPDGKILVVGETSALVGSPTDGYIARLNTDGTLDSTFGVGGIVIHNNATNARDYLYDVQVADNKIYVFGSARYDGTGASARALVLKLNMDGSRDTSFGINGEKFFFATGQTAFIFHGEVLSDGKMIVLGSNINPSRQWFVSKLNADGSFDTSFGTGGTFIMLTESVNLDNDLKIDAEGNILVVCHVGPAASYRATAFRLKPNGTLDTDFATNGIYTFPDGTRSYSGNAHLINDELYFWAYQEAMPIWSKNLIKLNAKTGIPISSFGTNGIYKYDLMPEMQNTNVGYSLLMNDQIIIGGRQGNQFSMVSLNLKDGSLTDKFAINGIYTSLDQNPTQSVLRLVAHPVTKKLYGVGLANTTTSNQLINLVHFR